MGYFTGVLDYIAGRRAEQMKTRDEVLLAIAKAGDCTTAHVKAWEDAGGDLLELQSRIERMLVRQEATANLQRADLMQKKIDAALKKMSEATEHYQIAQKTAQQMVDDAHRELDVAIYESRQLQYEQKELRESATATLWASADPVDLDELNRLKSELQNRTEHAHSPQRGVVRNERGDIDYSESRRCADELAYHERYRAGIQDLQNQIMTVTAKILNPTNFKV